MAELMLFHHAQGRTPGVLELAAEIERAGHIVHVPDLFDGRTFTTLDEGVAHAGDVGFGTIIERGAQASAGLGDALVYAGLSLGVLPAQQLAQTRDGARGALLFHACVPVTEFSDAWPPGVPVQIHAMEQDPFFVDDGDIDAARALVDATAEAEMFLYPGDQHLFTDSGLPSYDAAATRLVIERVLAFLART